MIDPHVHLRDWEQSPKETVRHGLEVARRAGLDAVFEMPNTVPPLTSRAVLQRRIALADAALRELGGRVIHGLYAGITDDAEQVREVVAAHAALFPRVVGLKLYAGHSTGGMGIVTESAQRLVYRRLASLGYRGVLAVHAEKESLLRKRPDGSADWEPGSPRSHAAARPPEAEVRSVEEQIRLAAEEGFRGVLHVAHVSVPGALAAIRRARERGVGFTLSCGITPHHALLASEDMDGQQGLLLKTNPPLRGRELQRAMLRSLLCGEIDWVESDHAPHTLRDKLEHHASGIPVLPFHRRFLSILRALGATPVQIERITHRNVERTFGLAVSRADEPPESEPADEYPFDPFSVLR